MTTSFNSESLNSPIMNFSVFVTLWLNYYYLLTVHFMMGM